jgi:hypothetical protein
LVVNAYGGHEALEQFPELAFDSTRLELKSQKLETNMFMFTVPVAVLAVGDFTFDFIYSQFDGSHTFLYRLHYLLGFCKGTAMNDYIVCIPCKTDLWVIDFKPTV